MTPFEFGRAVKLAQDDALFEPDLETDPLGVGNRAVPNRFAAGVTHLLTPPRPFNEVFRNNLAIPKARQPTTNKYRPPRLKIQGGQPLKVINPNKQTT